jgi:hypothetical protein
VKLVLFEETGGDVRPGVLTAGGVVDVAAAVPQGHTPQLTMQGITMQGIIDGFEGLRPALDMGADSTHPEAVKRNRPRGAG